MKGIHIETPERVLHYWFGRVEETIVPSETRADLWFSENQEGDVEVRNLFGGEVEHALQHGLGSWEHSPRGLLGLILLLDPLSRRVYRGDSRAFAGDPYALELCKKALAAEEDRAFSLMERVFFYFPLLHSEALVDQTMALEAYRRLMQLSLSETKLLYQSFFKFAEQHYSIVERFGRFPQRNALLGRESTPEEKLYLERVNKG